MYYLESWWEQVAATGGADQNMQLIWTVSNFSSNTKATFCQGSHLLASCKSASRLYQTSPDSYMYPVISSNSSFFPCVWGACLVHSPPAHLEGAQKNRLGVSWPCSHISHLWMFVLSFRIPEITNNCGWLQKKVGCTGKTAITTICLHIFIWKHWKISSLILQGFFI